MCLKKFVLVLLFFSSAFSFCFAESYEHFYDEGRKYEEEGNWYYAYTSFFNAIKIEPTENCYEALVEFQNIENAFLSGIPGLGKYETSEELQDGWIILASNFERYWTENCPKVFKLSSFEKTNVNFQNRTADFSIYLDYDDSPEYEELSYAVYSGFGKVFSNEWKGISKEWPLVSVYDSCDDSYFVEGVALVDIGGSLSPASLISWHDILNNTTSSFYDLKFNLTDLKGNIIYQGSRNIVGYKSILTLTNVSSSTMRMIESNSVLLEPTGLFLEFGYIPRYDSSNREWLSELPELDMSRTNYVFEFEAEYKRSESPIVVASNACKNIFVRDLICYHKVNGQSFESVKLEGGRFEMGSMNGEDDEWPVHSVTLLPFEIARTEVTQELFEAITGKNISDFKGERKPVEKVSWYDAVAFCNLLSIAEGYEPCYFFGEETDPANWNYEICESVELDGEIFCNFNANGYRLPTEAEWEYAARGGNFATESVYSGSNDWESVAWFFYNGDEETHEVALKQMNEAGIYDMSGNVWEWCWDYYFFYSAEEAVNPTGPADGDDKVLRGGGYGSDNPTVFYRGCNELASRNNYNGFRICRSIFEGE